MAIATNIKRVVFFQTRYKSKRKHQRRLIFTLDIWTTRNNNEDYEEGTDEASFLSLLYRKKT
jgi:hypothetical protein